MVLFPESTLSIFYRLTNKYTLRCRYPYNPIDTGYENAGYEPNYDDPYAYDSDYIPDVKTLLEKYGAFAGKCQGNMTNRTLHEKAW